MHAELGLQQTGEALPSPAALGPGLSLLEPGRPGALPPWAGRGGSQGCLLGSHPVLFKQPDWTAGEAEALSLKGPPSVYLGDVSSDSSCVGG